MKKIFLIIPVFLINCNKKEMVTNTSSNNDSTVVISQNAPENSMDSANNGVVSQNDTKQNQKEISPTFRVVEGNKIIKTLNGDMIPMKVTDEFTQDNQQFVLKIKNFNGKKIIGEIVPENPQMNIRFNQIKLANGDYDGPFGRDINYDVKESGEIWLIISRSNMASGETKGKFSVNLQ